MTYTEERRRILIVEDDIDIADLVTIYLHNQNYITHVAHTLEEATKLLEQRRPDLILCDIMLPDGTGTDWIRGLRKSADLPVIFLSSRQETEDIVQGLELGDDYITKPFDPDIMVARVKKDYDLHPPHLKTWLPLVRTYGVTAGSICILTALKSGSTAKRLAYLLKNCNYCSSWQVVQGTFLVQTTFLNAYGG